MPWWLILHPLCCLSQLFRWNMKTDANTPATRSRSCHDLDTNSQVIVPVRRHSVATPLYPKLTDRNQAQMLRTPISLLDVKYRLPAKLDGLYLEKQVRPKEQPLYSQSIQQVANLYQCVIGLRLPSKSAAGLLKAGYPSKNFHVKAKSSDFGPMAGFICEKAEYSKVSPSQHSKQAESVKDSLKKGARAVQLCLSNERVTQLIELGKMSELHTSEGDYRIFEATFKPDRRVQFLLDQAGLVFERENNLPVNVLTNPPLINKKDALISDSPITADYDLFCIYPRINQSNNPLPLNLTPRYDVQGEFIKQRLEQLYPLATSSDKQGDADMGNIHSFGKTVVNRLNLMVSTQYSEPYKGGILFWHGDETGNPFSPGFVAHDRPLFYIPSFENPIQIESREELSQLHDAFIETGYMPTFNPRL
jgi:insecticidal toxin complex protein TccC